MGKKPGNSHNISLVFKKASISLIIMCALVRGTLMELYSLWKGELSARERRERGWKGDNELMEVAGKLLFKGVLPTIGMGRTRKGH